MDTLITYFESTPKCNFKQCLTTVENKDSNKRKQLIAGWLRNKAVAHRTIQREHTRPTKKKGRRKTKTTTIE